MQYFTLIGGFIGFALTLAASILAGKELGTSVFNATVGCVIIAFLFRGLHFVTVFCAKQVVSERTRLRDEELATAEAAALEKIPSEEAVSTSSNTPA